MCTLLPLYMHMFARVYHAQLRHACPYALTVLVGHSNLSDLQLLRVCNCPQGQQQRAHKLAMNHPAPATITHTLCNQGRVRLHWITCICRQLRSRAVKEVHFFNRWPAPPLDTFLRCWQPELDARLAAVRELSATRSNAVRRLQGRSGLHGRARRLTAADANTGRRRAVDTALRGRFARRRRRARRRLGR